MRIKSFEFSLRELAGSLGDFGTLFPLAIGYITSCGLNPTGFLIMMGIANIATGLIYELPMPLQPMKVLAVVAIAHRWPPTMIYASAFSTGLIWLVFALTGIMDYIAKITPDSVITGIQVSLGLLLAFQAYEMVSASWAIGIAAILIIIVLHKNKNAPASVVLLAFGIIIMLFTGQLSKIGCPSLTLPFITSFKIKELWRSLVEGGFAQIPLTATNAVIATAVLIKKYWPEKPVSEKRLSLNMGLMNLIVPFFGGMPMCHGAGGLAGQYFYGARTGGTNIIEGLIEVLLGLFFATSIAAFFIAFPTAIIGAMMLLVGLELVKFGKDIHFDTSIIPVAATVIVSLVSNMAYGFIAGMIIHYSMDYILKKFEKKEPVD